MHTLLSISVEEVCLSKRTSVLMVEIICPP